MDFQQRELTPSLWGKYHYSSHYFSPTSPSVYPENSSSQRAGFLYHLLQESWPSHRSRSLPQRRSLPSRIAIVYCTFLWRLCSPHPTEWYIRSNPRTSHDDPSTSASKGTPLSSKRYSFTWTSLSFEDLHQGYTISELRSGATLRWNSIRRSYGIQRKPLGFFSLHLRALRMTISFACGLFISSFKAPFLSRCLFSTHQSLQ